MFMALTMMLTAAIGAGMVIPLFMKSERLQELRTTEERLVEIRQALLDHYWNNQGQFPASISSLVPTNHQTDSWGYAIKYLQGSKKTINWGGSTYTVPVVAIGSIGANQVWDSPPFSNDSWGSGNFNHTNDLVMIVSPNLEEYISDTHERLDVFAQASAFKSNIGNRSVADILTTQRSNYDPDDMVTGNYMSAYNSKDMFGRSFVWDSSNLVYKSVPISYVIGGVTYNNVVVGQPYEAFRIRAEWPATISAASGQGCGSANTSEADLEIHFKPPGSATWLTSTNMAPRVVADVDENGDTIIDGNDSSGWWNPRWRQSIQSCPPYGERIDISGNRSTQVMGVQLNHWWVEELVANYAHDSSGNRVRNEIPLAGTYSFRVKAKNEGTPYRLSFWKGYDLLWEQDGGNDVLNEKGMVLERTEGTLAEDAYTSTTNFDIPLQSPGNSEELSYSVNTSNNTMQITAKWTPSRNAEYQRITLITAAPVAEVAKVTSCTGTNAGDCTDSFKVNTAVKTFNRTYYPDDADKNIYYVMVEAVAENFSAADHVDSSSTAQQKLDNCNKRGTGRKCIKIGVAGGNVALTGSQLNFGVVPIGEEKSSINFAEANQVRITNDSANITRVDLTVNTVAATDSFGVPIPAAFVTNPFSMNAPRLVLGNVNSGANRIGVVDVKFQADMSTTPGTNFTGKVSLDTLPVNADLNNTQVNMRGCASGPVLNVNPLLTEHNFQVVNMGSSEFKKFTVSNSGGGTLTGSARFTSNADSVFTMDEDTDADGSVGYALSGTSQKVITVRFNSPTNSSNYNFLGTVQFDGGNAQCGVDSQSPVSINFRGRRPVYRNVLVSMDVPRVTVNVIGFDAFSFPRRVSTFGNLIRMGGTAVTINQRTSDFSNHNVNLANGSCGLNENLGSACGSYLGASVLNCSGSTPEGLIQSSGMRVNLQSLVVGVCIDLPYPLPDINFNIDAITLIEDNARTFNATNPGQSFSFSGGAGSNTVLGTGWTTQNVKVSIQPQCSCNCSDGGPQC